MYLSRGKSDKQQEEQQYTVARVERQLTLVFRLGNCLIDLRAESMANEREESAGYRFSSPSCCRVDPMHACNRFSLLLCNIT